METGKSTYLFVGDGGAAEVRVISLLLSWFLPARSVPSVVGTLTDSLSGRPVGWGRCWAGDGAGFLMVAISSSLFVLIIYLSLWN